MVQCLFFSSRKRTEINEMQQRATEKNIAGRYPSFMVAAHPVSIRLSLSQGRHKLRYPVYVAFLSKNCIFKLMYLYELKLN